MAFRTAAAITTSSFLIGILLFGLSVDYPVLFKPYSSDAYARAEQYYLLWWHAPPPVTAFLLSVIGALIFSIAAKLASWSESALYFDGLSLLTFIAAFAFYAGVAVPGVHQLAEDDGIRPLYMLITKQSLAEVKATVLDDEARREQIGIIGASNVLCIVCLGLIIALQGGQWWAERSEAKELAQMRQAEKDKKSK